MPQSPAGAGSSPLLATPGQAIPASMPINEVSAANLATRTGTFPPPGIGDRLLSAIVRGLRKNPPVGTGGGSSQGLVITEESGDTMDRTASRLRARGKFQPRVSLLEGRLLLSTAAFGLRSI